MRNREQLDEVFTYHKPVGDDQANYEVIRARAKEFADLIFVCCPECADRTVALRHVREAVMNANASIALKGLI